VHYFEGARQRCETLGYHLEEYWLREPGMTEQRVGEILFNRGIHGVLVAPLPPGGAAMHFDWAKFSGATIGYSLTEAALHRAGSDPFHSALLAVQELMRLGYRRLGLALTRAEDVEVEQRWSAALLAHQAEIAPELRVPILRAEGSFGEEFVAWFRAHRPDAVLSLSSECLPLLADLGVRVPKDAGFAHLALTPSDHDCAGVDAHAEIIGATAVDLVDVQLRRNELGLPQYRKTVHIAGRWVPGPTLREPAKRRK
jgi:LacI family transcriptional regulator